MFDVKRQTMCVRHEVDKQRLFGDVDQNRSEINHSPIAWCHEQRHQPDQRFDKRPATTRLSNQNNREATHQQAM